MSCKNTLFNQRGSVFTVIKLRISTNHQTYKIKIKKSHKYWQFIILGTTVFGQKSPFQTISEYWGEGTDKRKRSQRRTLRLMGSTNRVDILVK